MEREVQTAIEQRFQAPDYVSLYRAHEQQLQALFAFLVKETFQPVGRPHAHNCITFRTFSWFAERFQLWPEAISKYDVFTIFGTLTRDKPIVDHTPIAMNYLEFTHALLRMSIKGKKVFNVIAQKIKAGGATEKEMADIVQKEGTQLIRF